jgi:hypothetical protein
MTDKADNNQSDRPLQQRLRNLSNGGKANESQTKSKIEAEDKKDSSNHFMRYKHTI